MFRKRVERQSAASAVRSNRHVETAPAGSRYAAAADPVQRLEPRQLFAVSLAFEGLFNASKFPGNQSETAIAINRTNPNNIFAASNYGAFREPDQGPNDPIAETGIFTTFSLDNGATWTPRVMAKDDAFPIGVSDDNSNAAGARPIGDINLTDTAGGTTADVTVGALATDAAGMTYAINLGPGNRIQIATLSFPTAPVGAQGQVTATTVADVYAPVASAGGAALNGGVGAIGGADFNPVDGRLYFTVTGLPGGNTPNSDLLFSVDVNPALSRAQREASVALVGNFGTAALGIADVTGITFDRVATGVRLIGILGSGGGNQIFSSDLTDVTIVNPVAVTAQNNSTGPRGSIGAIQVHRDTPDAPNDVIAIASGIPTAPGAAFRIGTDGVAIELGPLANTVGATGESPAGIAFVPSLLDPFTLRPGAYVGVDATTDELFYVDTRDRVFPVACCDPSAAYDQFGNLYFAYLAMDPITQRSSIAVLASVDNGQNFFQIAELFGEQPTEPVSVDRCEVVAAPLPDGTAGVWVTYVDFSSTAFTITAAGMNATGLGAYGTTDVAARGPFNTPQKLPQGGPGTGATLPHNLAHPSVGPNGEVTVAHQEVGRNPLDKIFVNTDPDGLGPANFGNSVFIDQTQLTFDETLPGQPTRGIGSVPTLAYDRSNGPHRGRLYIAYAQATTENRTDVRGRPISTVVDAEILVRYSDDRGATWSQPVRANDDPITDPNSQFFQRIAVDPVTGNVAVGWLDSRDDQAGGDEDDEIGYYATVGQSVGNGLEFAPNIRLNVGLSNARFSGNFGNDYGDYTGLDIYDSVLWAAYPDNTNSTGDNPSGKLRAFDIYAARVRVTDTTVQPPPFVTPASPLSPTVFRPQSLVRGGRFYNLRVTYSHPSGVNLGTVGNDDVVVTGPSGFSQAMTLVRARANRRTNSVTATYRMQAPGGTWDAAENGVYTATLQAGAVTSTDASTTTTAGNLTSFNVNARQRRVRGAGRLATPAVTALASVSPTVFSNISVLSDDDERSLALLA